MKLKKYIDFINEVHYDNSFFFNYRKHIEKELENIIDMDPGNFTDSFSLYFSQNTELDKKLGYRKDYDKNSLYLHFYIPHWSDEDRDGEIVELMKNYIPKNYTHSIKKPKRSRGKYHEWIFKKEDFVNLPIVKSIEGFEKYNL